MDGTVGSGYGSRNTQNLVVLLSCVRNINTVKREMKCGRRRGVGGRERDVKVGWVGVGR
jgi:hypothetical protein